MVCDTHGTHEPETGAVGRRRTQRAAPSSVHRHQIEHPLTHRKVPAADPCSGITLDPTAKLPPRRK